MEKICRKINLEGFRSRFFGKLPSVSSVDTENVSYGDVCLHYGYPFGEYQGGDWYNDYGKIPYNVKFSEKIGGTEDAVVIHDRLCDISDRLCSDGYMPYRRMVEVYGLLSEIYRNGDYYTIHNDGKELCFIPTERVDYRDARLLFASYFPEERYLVTDSKYGLDGEYPYPLSFTVYVYDGGYTTELAEIPYEYVYTDAGGNMVSVSEKPSDVYYSLRRKKYKEVVVSAEGPSYTEKDLLKYPDGYVLCVHEGADEMLRIFSDTGEDYPGRNRYDADFYDLCRILYEKVVDIGTDDFRKMFDVPCIPQCLSLSHDYAVFGSYRPYYLTWNADRVYERHIVVSYGGEYYYLNKEGEYFGTESPDRDPNWVRLYRKEYHDGFVTGLVPSRIHEYEDKKRYDIDDDGNELPFYVDSEGGVYTNNEGRVYTNLRVANEIPGNNGDSRVSVIYKVEMARQSEYDEPVEIPYDKALVRGRLSYCPEMEGYEYLVFHYCKDAETKDGRVLEDSGIHYTDVFYFTINTYDDFRFAGKWYRGMKYIDIDFTSSNYTELYTDGPMSKIRFRPTNLILDENAEELMLYRNDADMSVTDLTVNSRVVVERSEDSKANAYWRHMKLGEIQDVRQIERENLF